METLSVNGYQATKAEMCTLTGKSMGYIGDLLTGRGKDEQQKHGLFYKCPYLTTDGKRPYTLILQEDWAKEIGGSKITLKRKT